MSENNIIANNEHSSVKERLLKFIEFKKLNPKQFEEIAGLSTSYISNMRKSIKPSTFDEKIAPKFPELNKMWLLHNEGYMINGEGKDSKTQVTERNIENLPHGEQMKLLQNEIIELRNELKDQTKYIIEIISKERNAVTDILLKALKEQKKESI